MAISSVKIVILIFIDYITTTISSKPIFYFLTMNLFSYLMSKYSLICYHDSVAIDMFFLKDILLIYLYVLVFYLALQKFFVVFYRSIKKYMYLLQFPLLYLK